MLGSFVGCFVGARETLKPLRSVYQILQHRNHFFVINSTYFSSFRKLGRRFFNGSVFFFQAALMSKSDKSLLPLRRQDNFLAVRIGVELLLADSYRGLLD